MGFPGVVPRSFLGAAIVAAVSSPFHLLQHACFPKAAMLTVVRLMLGSICWLSMCRLQQALHKQYGSTCAKAFMIVTAMQFHLPFYMSRTLPNTFALAVLGLAIADWIEAKHPRRLVSLLAFATIVFRCDMLPLAGLVGLHMLLTKQLSIPAGLLTGAVAAAMSVCTTVLVDSWFWQRCLWPEGEVLWFNTAQNRSGEWGIMPFHWYFTSALPRALLGAYPLAVLGLLWEPRVRFLLPVLPVLNIASAAALARIWNNRYKQAWLLPGLAACLLVLGSTCATSVMLTVSRHNYPGGHALHELHKWQANNFTGSKGPFSVHIDVLPAMTGVSRFGELGDPWTYSKEENLSLEELHHHGFTHLLSTAPNVTGFAQVTGVAGYQGFQIPRCTQQLVKVTQAHGLPFSITLAPEVFILIRKACLM
ncbi:TPA: hypothetical protein ACH3X1_004835 [Trebouxia sp. C0004]